MGIYNQRLPSSTVSGCRLKSQEINYKVQDPGNLRRMDNSPASDESRQLGSLEHHWCKSKSQEPRVWYLQVMVTAPSPNIQLPFKKSGLCPLAWVTPLTFYLDLAHSLLDNTSHIQDVSSPLSSLICQLSLEELTQNPYSVLYLSSMYLRLVGLTDLPGVALITETNW